MKHPLATFLHATLGKLLLVLFKVRVHGIENIPAGGAVISGNHVSHMDPVLLWCRSPRPVHFMAKRELWDSAFIGWLLPRLYAFPVNRGGADRGAIETATAYLKAGDLVGIFPEGTRSEDGQAMGEAHGGAAFIAMRAGVPVVPAAFVGTQDVLGKGRRLPRLRRVTVVFGEPIHPDDFQAGGRKERVAAMTETIMQRIGQQLERARELH